MVAVEDDHNNNYNIFVDSKYSISFVVGSTSLVGWMDIYMVGWLVVTFYEGGNDMVGCGAILGYKYMGYICLVSMVVFFGKTQKMKHTSPVTMQSD